VCGLSGEEQRRKDAHQGERGGGHILGTGEVRLSAGRWAHGDIKLKQLDKKKPFS